jgi:hypothetical protein
VNAISERIAQKSSSTQITTESRPQPARRSGSCRLLRTKTSGLVVAARLLLAPVNPGARRATDQVADLGQLHQALRLTHYFVAVAEVT